MLDHGGPKEGRPRDCYRPEYVRVSAEAKEWSLVGVAGGLYDGGMVLFWDTRRPSVGRTDSV